jgi:hypothetical protein|tara:strand:+ start:1342 stop:1551 length:210 start_codon:yes stop_codon:yes gene_type:complete
MNAQHNEMTMDEMDQVTGGMYLPGREGPARPLAFWWVVLAAVGAGVIWGAGKVSDGLDKVQQAADDSKK